MSRKKLPESEKKVKLSISVDATLNKMLNELTNNKSKFIERILKEHLKDYTITESIDVKYDNDKYIGMTKAKIINRYGKNM